MTCIPKLLEMKGDKEIFYLNGNCALLTGGNYRSYEFIIILNTSGYRWGYVSISEALFDKYFNKEYAHQIDLDVHGGITFCDTPEDFIFNHFKEKISCDNVWLGFDAGHAGDAGDFDAVDYYFPHLKDETNYYRKLHKRYPIPSDTIKDTAYMTNECKKMIDQIIELRGESK